MQEASQPVIHTILMRLHCLLVYSDFCYQKMCTCFVAFLFKLRQILLSHSSAEDMREISADGLSNVTRHVFCHQTEEFVHHEVLVRMRAASRGVSDIFKSLKSSGDYVYCLYLTSKHSVFFSKDCIYERFIVV